jgi:hypothetical protein
MAIKMKVEDAWRSPQTVIWNGGDAYQILSVLGSAQTFYTVKITISTIIECFGSLYCVNNFTRL